MDIYAFLKTEKPNKAKAAAVAKQAECGRKLRVFSHGRHLTSMVCHKRFATLFSDFLRFQRGVFWGLPWVVFLKLRWFFSRRLQRGNREEWHSTLLHRSESSRQNVAPEIWFGNLMKVKDFFGAWCMFMNFPIQKNYRLRGFQRDAFLETFTLKTNNIPT